MAGQTETQVSTIMDWIDIGRLNPGDVIDESKLVAELTISRTPVREALRQLVGIFLDLRHCKVGRDLGVVLCGQDARPQAEGADRATGIAAKRLGSGRESGDLLFVGCVETDVPPFHVGLGQPEDPAFGVWPDAAAQSLGDSLVAEAGARDRAIQRLDLPNQVHQQNNPRVRIVHRRRAASHGEAVEPVKAFREDTVFHRYHGTGPVRERPLRSRENLTPSLG